MRQKVTPHPHHKQNVGPPASSLGHLLPKGEGNKFLAPSWFGSAYFDGYGHRDYPPTAREIDRPYSQNRRARGSTRGKERHMGGSARAELS
jgi:hypothetical protein